MYKKLSIALLALLSMETVLASNNEGSQLIYNRYTGAGFVQTLPEEDRRKNVENSILLGGVREFIAGSDALLLAFNENELARKQQKLTNAQKNRLIALFGSSSLTVEMNMSNRHRSVDCKSIAEKIELSKKTKGSEKGFESYGRTLTKVSCYGDPTQSEMSETVQVRPTYVRYDQEEYINPVFRTEKKERCIKKFLWWCTKRKVETKSILVSAGQTNYYDKRREENWAYRLGNNDTAGRFTESWSYFNYVGGWVPISVGGITTFIETDVKKSTGLWQAKPNSDTDKQAEARTLELRGEQFASGSKVILRCGDAELGGNNPFSNSGNSNENIFTVSTTLQDDMATACAINDAYIRFENIKGDELPRGIANKPHVMEGDRLSVTFNPRSTIYLPAENIAHYISSLGETFKDQYEAYEEYLELLEPFKQTGKFDPTAVDVPSSLQEIRSKSEILLERMLEYKGDYSLISPYFYSYSSVEPKEGDVDYSFPSELRAQLDGAYIPSLNDDFQDPHWFKSFVSWTVENKYTEHDFSSISESINRTYLEVVLATIEDSSVENLTYPYENQLFTAWFNLSETLILIERIKSQLQSYGPHTGNSPAYGSAGGDSAYQAAMSKIDLMLNRELANNYPTWELLSGGILKGKEDLQLVDL